MFNEDEDEDVKDIRYLFNVEEMKELTESQVNNIKEKLIKFKSELIRKNKINNRIKKILIIITASKILDICLMKMKM